MIKITIEKDGERKVIECNYSEDKVRELSLENELVKFIVVDIFRTIRELVS